MRPTLAVASTLTLSQNFEKAKYRGVAFEVAASDTAVGRRVSLKEFPLREFPSTEDLGRKATEFVVKGFIVGEDYIDRMKALMAALMLPGPGTLVHPSLGSLDVVLVEPSRLHEQFIERRGMVTFALKFCESGSPAVRDEVDTQQVVDDAATACYGKMEDDFASRFSIAGLPAWAIDSITGEISRINDALTSVRRSLQFDLTSLSRLDNMGNLFKSNLIGLLATPNALATELTTLVRGIGGLFDFSAAQEQVFGSQALVTKPLDSLLAMGTYGLAGSIYARPAIPQTTPVRRQQAANQNATFSLVSRAAVVEAVRSSIYVPFASADEALALRDRLSDALDTLMLDASDDVYPDLQALHGAMVRDITTRGAELASLSELTLPASLPAAVLSYRLYGNLDYADEIVARNQQPGTLLHPLFLPGGTPLGVRRV